MNPKRRWVWVGYWGGAALLAVVLLVVSAQVIGFERSEARAQAERELEETTQLALWQMDSWVAPMLAMEARRPYFEYRAVLPVGRAYDAMWEAPYEGEPVVPSPLLTRLAVPSETESLVRMHLQIEPDGTATSPQSPSNAELVRLVLADPGVEFSMQQRDRVSAILPGLGEALRTPPPVATTLTQPQRGVPTETLTESRAESQLESMSALPSAEFDDGTSALVGTPNATLGQEQFKDKRSFEQYSARDEIARLAQQPQIYLDATEPGVLPADTFLDEASPARSNAYVVPDERLDASLDGLADMERQRDRPFAEQAESRSAGAAPAAAEVEHATEGVAANSSDFALDMGQPVRAARSDESVGLSVLSSAALADRGRALSPYGSVEVGPLQPRWVTLGTSPELLYLRTVRVQGQPYQQGVWLDWPSLAGELLELADELPAGSELVPVMQDRLDLASADPGRRLATVPAVLRVPIARGMDGGMTPARWSLLLMWLAVLVSAGAIGVVLRAAMRLSDRRVRFVGAVTHELRTPLTTFRLYSQMLADGMVSDEDSRREYLRTLKEESGRLAGIVENVLAYARLNRAGTGSTGRTETLTPEQLLVRLVPGLSRRAEQSGMDLIVSNEAAGVERELLVDPQSVERVLTNLVDNACKYAAPGPDDSSSLPDTQDAVVDDGAFETRIHLDVRIAGDQLEMLVADYGPGIDPVDRARVFGEFQRGRAGQRADRSGLGLGLALSRGLARESGGELRLVRRRGHGAEFLLSLPLRASEASD